MTDTRERRQSHEIPMSKRHSKTLDAAPRSSRLESAAKWVTALSVAGIAALGVSSLRPLQSESPQSEQSAPVAFLPTIENASRPPKPAPPGMVFIPGGEFSMGAQDPPSHAAISSVCRRRSIRVPCTACTSTVFGWTRRR